MPAHGGNDCDGERFKLDPCNMCPCESGALYAWGFLSLNPIGLKIHAQEPCDQLTEIQCGTEGISCSTCWQLAHFLQGGQ